MRSWQRVHRGQSAPPDGLTGYDAPERRNTCIFWRDDDRRGARRRELHAITRIGEKRDRLRPGVLERSDPQDDGIAVAVEAGTDLLRELCEPHGISDYLSASALITFSVMSMRWLAKTTGS